jgi:hypothetical protein
MLGGKPAGVVLGLGDGRTDRGEMAADFEFDRRLHGPRGAATIAHGRAAQEQRRG